MKNQTSTAAAALSVFAGGCRDNMHFQAPEDLTQEPATITIGPDAYAASVIDLRRNSDGRICYVKAARHGSMGEIQFRLRKSGQLRSAGHGSYGLVLGFAETRLDRSF